MTREELNKVLELHKMWLNDEGGGVRADLRGADLRGADLQRADLRGADFDYSCLPLWCGSNQMKVDGRIAMQIAAHFCALDCDDEEYIAARNSILDFAKQSLIAHHLTLPALAVREEEK